MYDDLEVHIDLAYFNVGRLANKHPDHEILGILDGKGLIDEEKMFERYFPTIRGLPVFMGYSRLWREIEKIIGRF